MTQVISKDSELNISQEFIESGKSLQPPSKKRGGHILKMKDLSGKPKYIGYILNLDILQKEFLK